MESMMSFFDRVTKAVGDVVDKGKKDVDQFMKIQKINGEIGGMEKKIAVSERGAASARRAAASDSGRYVQSRPPHWREGR
jgi:hypothetical protein